MKMKTVLIGAGSDLGVHVDGSRLAPKRLLTDLASFYQGETQLLEQNPNIIKSRSLADKRKNDVELEKFNQELYHTIEKYLKESFFPIIIGGDHSVSIPSCLADANQNETIGMILFSTHAFYHTFETTPNGNLHELATATVNGYRTNELKNYHTGNIIPSKNTVIIGPVNISKNERENIRYSGATVFTLEDIRKQGMETILNQAFAIATEKTAGVHICFNLDILSPNISTGVSIPEEDGITEEEAMEILNYILTQIEKLTALDLTEFNPLRDPTRKTEQIAVNLLAKTIMAIEKK